MHTCTVTTPKLHHPITASEIAFTIHKYVSFFILGYRGTSNALNSKRTSLVRVEDIYIDIYIYISNSSSISFHRVLKKRLNLTSIPDFQVKVLWVYFSLHFQPTEEISSLGLHHVPLSS
jgi:hypothetical protein